MTKADKERQRKTPILRFKGFTDDWEQRKLGDVVSIKSGWSPYKFVHKENSHELFIKVDDLNHSYKFQSDSNYKVENNSKLDKIEQNSVIFPKRGAAIKTNKVRILKHAGYIDTNIMALQSKGIGHIFLYNLILKDGLYKIADTSTIPQINNKHVIPYKVFIPSKQEQRMISLFIDKLDLLLTLYERKIKLLSQLKKYFLDNLFTEKEYPNLRFKGFTDAWEKIKLKDTQTTLTDGNYANLYPKPADMTDADKGIPFLTGGNLKNGILDLENAKYITKEKHSQLKSGHLEEDDIVIAVRGSLGELGYVTKQNIDWNINSQLAIIRTSKNELIGKFLLYFFLSSKGKSKLLSRQTGTALKQLPLQQLKTIVVPKTLLLEQQKISNILKTIDKTISFYKDKQQHLAEIKNTLLNTMFI